MPDPAAQVILPGMARSRGTWNRETALEMGRRAVEARRHRAEARKAAGAVRPSLALPVIPPPDPEPGFESLSLARVRAHLHNLHQVIASELLRSRPDPQRLHWLSKSLAEMAEIERRLAGRPLPVSRRPAPESARRPQADPPPEAEPEPIAEPAPPAGLLTDRPEW